MGAQDRSQGQHQCLAVAGVSEMQPALRLLKCYQMQRDPENEEDNWEFQQKL